MTLPRIPLYTLHLFSPSSFPLSSSCSSVDTRTEAARLVVMPWRICQALWVKSTLCCPASCVPSLPSSQIEGGGVALHLLLGLTHLHSLYPQPCSNLTASPKSPAIPCFHKGPVEDTRKQQKCLFPGPDSVLTNSHM